MAMGPMHIGPAFVTMQVSSLVPFLRVCIAPFTTRTMVASFSDLRRSCGHRPCRVFGVRALSRPLGIDNAREGKQG